MNFRDKSILTFIKKQDRMVCGPRPLVHSNQTSIWIDTDALEDYSAGTISDISCCYTPFYGFKSAYYYEKECIEFTESADIYYEYIKVNCSLLKVNKSYVDFHAFIVPKVKHIDHNEINDQDDLSVLIIGIDSVSRLNLQRQMPITKSFIESLDPFQFLGYSKVGDNTFPNLMPFLTGHTVQELLNICWKGSKDYFDKCPFIWKNFSEKNYYTVFTENMVNIGLFNYNGKGFRIHPTDYYPFPFWGANERTIGHTKLLNTYYCYNSRFATEVFLDYTIKFVENMTLSNKKFWGVFFDSSLTHDFFNYLPNTDGMYFEFFEKIRSRGYMNKTAVIVVSDHGLRFGSVLRTNLGRVESRIPFLYILLPKWFQNKYKNAVKNMRANSHALTTHFDIHETLKDFLNIDNIRDENLIKKQAEGLNKRGISLFFPIPKERSCESAGIVPIHCLCGANQVIPNDAPIVKEAASFAVRHINSLLRSEKKCAKLQLKTISRVFETKFRNSTTSYSDLIITFTTDPSLSEFEADVRFFNDNKKMEVIGKILTITLYKHKSQCIRNYKIEPYCYCLDYKKKGKTNNKKLTTPM